MTDRDTFYSLLSTTRSIRRIKDTPIEKDVLERICQAAIWAPSGGNRQPWRLIVVQDQNIKEQLSALYVAEWDLYVDFNLKKLGEQPPEILEKVRAQFGTGTDLAHGLANIPAVAVFVHDPSALYVTDANLGRHPVVGGASLYPAVQNFLLAARAEGLGGVLTTLICSREKELRELLKFPDGWGVHAMVPFGYPKGKHGPLQRAPLSEMMSIDTWQG
ncbi:MAG: nitroreductase family protein [Ilumatobacteraceae bacterium]